MDVSVVGALFYPTIAGFILWRGLRPVTDPNIQAFVNRFFVRIEPSEVPFLRARLRRSRAVRAGAVATGILVAGLPAYVNLIDPLLVSYYRPFVGWAWLPAAALAAMFVELMVVQRPSLGRHATLETRRPHDFVASRWTNLLAGTGAVTLAVACLAVAVGRGERTELIAGAAGAVIAVGATRIGLVQITDRPRIAPDGPLRDLDDALRCYGAHHVVGAAMALAMTALSTVILALNTLGWSVLPILVVAMLAPWYGLSVWWRLAREERWPISHARATAR